MVAEKRGNEGDGDSRWDLTFGTPEDGLLTIRLAGDWRLRHGLPSVVEVERRLESAVEVRRVAFDGEGITRWDSGLLTFLLKVRETSRRRQVQVDPGSLPEGVCKLLALATAAPPKPTQGERRRPLLDRIGHRAADLIHAGVELITFLGEATLALLSLLRGRARFRHSDLLTMLQDAGPRALPIVSLISFLTGLIMAFVGAVQLRQFGAQIYVADLVGLAMSREMSAMMVGIIMAGRTGAAFAAQLGTMQVNEEIDALRTLAVSPMEFLVLPRMLALIVMMPLLTLYANLVGILGGAAVGVFMLGLNYLEYFEETRVALSVVDFATGIFKSAVFGVLVAVAGCLRGMQCGRSSAAVGIAATSAVVTGIVMIIVADAVFTVLFNILGI